MRRSPPKGPHDYGFMRIEVYNHLMVSQAIWQDMPEEFIFSSLDSLANLQRQVWHVPYVELILPARSESWAGASVVEHGL